LPPRRGPPSHQSGDSLRLESRQLLVSVYALSKCSQKTPASAGMHTVRHGSGSLMLKGLDPLLNADILAALRGMGHGDELVVSDANFPADAIARRTVLGRLLRMDGVDAPRAVRAIVSVLPLDSFVEHPALRMEVVDAPDEILPVHREVQAEIERAEGRTLTLAGIERMAFYERAKAAYCVIATGERRFYGCFILKKGVIPPGGSREP
jgi:L-fucose mutarotase